MREEDSSHSGEAKGGVQEYGIVFRIPSSFWSKFKHPCMTAELSLLTKSLSKPLSHRSCTYVCEQTVLFGRRSAAGIAGGRIRCRTLARAVLNCKLSL